MPSVNDIRQAGTDLLVTSSPLPVPISPAISLVDRLARFDPDIYNVSKDSHLYRFILALVGDSGAADLKKKLLYPRLQTLGNTFFSDLDLIYGNALSFPRLSAEKYSVDPKNEALTQSQWNDIFGKDAAYRNRTLTWTRAIRQGSSVLGMRLAGEAALGFECHVFERYKYLEDRRNGGNNVPNIGSTNTPNEFVILPQTTTLSAEQKRLVASLVDELRPANTIVTVLSGTKPIFQEITVTVSGSTNSYNVQTFVTGTNDVNWPPPDTTRGFFIRPGVETEAPTFAFMSPQEKIIFLEVQSTEASSFHVGSFNGAQQSLFANLRDTSAHPIVYSSQNSLSNSALLTASNQWIPGTSKTKTPVVLINQHYPLEYFQIKPPQNQNVNPFKFWASNEDTAGTHEHLLFDLGTLQTINYVEFDISQKPIDLTIQYSTDKIHFTNVTPDPKFNYSLNISYFPSETNPWFHFKLHFLTISARYIRITFTRREQLPPYKGPHGPQLPFRWPYPFSIEIRNFRVAYIVDPPPPPPDPPPVIPPTIDPIGNTYRIEIYQNPAANVLEDDSSYWQSQMNPSPFAVETLHFDVSNSGNPQVIDSIFIDPITSGPYLHIYYSNDDTMPWDWKLWTPIPLNYILKKGFVHMPYPINTKYIKLEFSNLTPVPYLTQDFDSLPPITFKKFPMWIQNYFETNYPITIEQDKILYPYSTVSIDPIEFGFLVTNDLLNNQDPTIPTNVSSAQNNELQQTLSAVTGKTFDPNQIAIESKIQFNSSFMYQNDLLSQLSDSRALSRFAKLNQDTLLQDDSVAKEAQVPDSPPITYQTQVDTRQAEYEKRLPIMYFPFQARHQYQVNQIDRLEKIAYFVGVRTVQFNRADYSVAWDQDFYIETMADNVNIATNEFSSNGWQFVVNQ